MDLRSRKKNQPSATSNEVKNFYEIIPKEFLDNTENPNFGKTHMFNLPTRAVVIGASGGGKSNWITNLIERFCDGKGSFASITIITKDKDEPLYKYLESLSDQIVIKEGLSNLPPLKDFDKSVNHLVIVDDMVLSTDQSRVESYYMACRKKNVSIFYLSQSYYRIPKFIRQNANWTILLKLSGERDIKMVLAEAAMGISKDTLLNMYNTITDQKFNSVLINMDAPRDGRYMKNFMEVINPLDYASQKEKDKYEKTYGTKPPDESVKDN
jgi:ABC-type dipeptide/oligopeptide/nickel transport system ATPase component